MHLSLMFEAFNIANNWSPTSLATQAYTETKTGGVYPNPVGTLNYTPTAFGFGTADGGFPDGTQARRLQVAARFTF
jgi:hypothetical protein